MAEREFLSAEAGVPRPWREIALRPKIFPIFFLADPSLGRRNGLFFEMDERCSSVIAVKCQGTR
jgi:hypothetical protein